MTEPGQSDVFIQQATQATNIIEWSISSEFHRDNQRVTIKDFEKPDFTGGHPIMQVKSFEPSNKPVGYIINECTLPLVMQTIADKTLNEVDASKENNRKKELARMTTEQLKEYAGFIEICLKPYNGLEVIMF
ncbi:590_t:CDS:2 [Paraglomus occultum]|uniref:590_t:CDS:1 n=1 Tax=Paraglomus occultum TaxID=144539 RepID=A0A9N9B4I6_9GLOM|nr:590_t:CDS:2 [Paraglomus occultum]